MRIPICSNRSGPGKAATSIGSDIVPLSASSNGGRPRPRSTPVEEIRTGGVLIARLWPPLSLLPSNRQDTPPPRCRPKRYPPLRRPSGPTYDRTTPTASGSTRCIGSLRITITGVHTAASAGLLPPPACKQRPWELHLAVGAILSFPSSFAPVELGAMPARAPPSW